MTRPTPSPWGAIESRTPVIAGVELIVARRACGFHLDRGRREELRRTFPAWKTESNDYSWFESHVDATLIPIVFASSFTPQEVSRAVRTAIYFGKVTATHPRSKWTMVVEWLCSHEPAAQACMRRADAGVLATVVDGVMGDM